MDPKYEEFSRWLDRNLSLDKTQVINKAQAYWVWLCMEKEIRDLKKEIENFRSLMEKEVQKVGADAAIKGYVSGIESVMDICVTLRKEIMDKHLKKTGEEDADQNS